MMLQEFYEGFLGANAKSMLATECDIQELFYAGEKPLHMWWHWFEVRMTNAFAQVHRDEIKLRMLNSKVKADFLVAMKTNIEMQMNMQPMVMTYSSALANYRNTVSQRHPTSTNTNPGHTCQCIESAGRCGGKGKGGRSQVGQDIRNGKSGRRGRNNPKGGRHNNEWQVTGLDGKTIRIHPAYRFESRTSGLTYLMM